MHHTAESAQAITTGYTRSKVSISKAARLNGSIVTVVWIGAGRMLQDAPFFIMIFLHGIAIRPFTTVYHISLALVLAVPGLFGSLVRGIITRTSVLLFYGPL
jgi:hypothetical protein